MRCPHSKTIKIWSVYFLIGDDLSSNFLNFFSLCFSLNKFLESRGDLKCADFDDFDDEFYVKKMFTLKNENIKT